MSSGCKESDRCISPTPKVRSKANRVTGLKKKQTRIETSRIKSKKFRTCAGEIRYAMIDRLLRHLINVTRSAEKAFADTVAAPVPLDRKQPPLQIRKERRLFMRERTKRPNRYVRYPGQIAGRAIGSEFLDACWRAVLFDKAHCAARIVLRDHLRECGFGREVRQGKMIDPRNDSKRRYLDVDVAITQVPNEG